MNREIHVRICGGLEVQFLRSTRRCVSCYKTECYFSAPVIAEFEISEPSLLLAKQTRTQGVITRGSCLSSTNRLSLAMVVIGKG